MLNEAIIQKIHDILDICHYSEQYKIKLNGFELSKLLNQYFQCNGICFDGRRYRIEDLFLSIVLCLDDVPKQFSPSLKNTLLVRFLQGKIVFQSNNVYDQSIRLISVAHCKEYVDLEMTADEAFLNLVRLYQNNIVELLSLQATNKTNYEKWEKLKEKIQMFSDQKIISENACIQLLKH